MKSLSFIVVFRIVGLCFSSSFRLSNVLRLWQITSMTLSDFIWTTWVFQSSIKARSSAFSALSSYRWSFV